MASIPANQLVNIQPSVISAGGQPLALNGLFLTQNTVLPVGQILAFPNQLSVASYFGPTSTEALLAANYFSGYSTMTQVPGALLFSAYAASAVAGWLRSAAITLTLAQVKAIIPATSTGSSIPQNSTTMTIGTVVAGSYTPGMLLTGSNVTSGTRIISQLTGTVVGGAGTYQVSISQAVASSAAAITAAYDLTVSIDGTPATAASLNLSAATSLSSAATLIGTALGLTGGQTIAYSSQFAAFTITSGTTGVNSSVAAASGQGAAALNLTTATGGTSSPGSAAMSESGAMNAIVALTQNWATFMTMWEPVLASKMNFAAWTTSQNQRWAYVCYDSDATIVNAGNTTSFGPQVIAGAYNGIIPVYLDPAVAAMICGTTAAINFNQTNGRITYAFKGQAGITPTVTNATVAANLIANGYNFYGAYATANQSFQLLQPGQISGAWDWIDEYINQIAMNNDFQLAGMTFMTAVNSLPYNNSGYVGLKNAWSSPIQKYLNFGAIVPGVTLSSGQIQELMMNAGLDISQPMFSKGYYMQVLDPGAVTRGVRGSPVCNFWYADGGSIQKLNLSSVDVQ